MKCWPCELHGAGGAMSSSRGDMLRLTCHGFRTTPRKSPVHRLPNWCTQKEQEQEQKSLHSWRKILRCEGDTCTLRQDCADCTNSDAKVRACKGQRAEAKGTTLPGAHCDKEPVALCYFKMPKGRERWFPVTALSFCTQRPLDLKENTKPDRFNSMVPLKIKFL